MITIGLVRMSGSSGQMDRKKRQGKRRHIGEVMGRVRQQGKTMSTKSGRSLKPHEPQRQNECPQKAPLRPAMRSDPMIVVMMVMSFVAVSH